MGNPVRQVLAFSAVVLVAGCSAITSFDGLTGGIAGDGNDGGETDGALDGAMNADAPSADGGTEASIDGGGDAPSGACDLAKPFGPAFNVPNVNTAAPETGARISPDGLTLYFSRGSGNARAIQMATRAALTDDFAMVEGVDAGEGLTSECPSVTGDGLTLYFQSPLPANNLDDIWVATRPNVLAQFGSSAAVPNVNDGTHADGEPIISADGNTLYFDSTRAGMYDIYSTTKVASGVFANPTLLGVSAISSNTGYPVPSSDGLTLFFGSDRPVGSAGAEDIWITQRSSLVDGFGAATNLSALNTSSQEWPTSISADGCTLYFASDRGGIGAQGMTDIWMATRPK